MCRLLFLMGLGLFFYHGGAKGPLSVCRRAVLLVLVMEQLPAKLAHRSLVPGQSERTCGDGLCVCVCVCGGVHSMFGYVVPRREQNLGQSKYSEENCTPSSCPI